MTERDSLTKTEDFIPDLAKSIFPAFAVNVPMPRDTAVPGSYPQQRPAGTDQTGTKGT
jgi:hypothetical protein